MDWHYFACSRLLNRRIYANENVGRLAMKSGFSFSWFFFLKCKLNHTHSSCIILGLLLGRFLWDFIFTSPYNRVCEHVCVFVDAVYECSKTRFYHFLELVLLQTPEAIPQPRLPLILNECSNRCWGYSQYFSKFNSSHIYFTYIKSISRI